MLEQPVTTVVLKHDQVLNHPTNDYPLMKFINLKSAREKLSVEECMHEMKVNSPATASQQPFVVEYYYKLKWGHADEFFSLFKKNHLPVLLKQVELGRLLQVTATKPRYHNTEEGRWDYRVTIVFKNASAAMDDFDEAALAKQLFPDQETFKREEQRRFEVLEAHWDLPIKTIDLDAK